MNAQALFGEYADDVYNLLVYMTHDPHTAEDLTQDTFVKILQNCHTFRGGSAKAWVLRIARNTAIDFFRKSRQEVSADVVDRLVTGTDSDPEAIVESHDTVTQLISLISELKPVYQDVIVCRLIMDLTTEEASATLGWSSTRVRVTLHRALATLRNNGGKEAWISGLQR